MSKKNTLRADPDSIRRFVDLLSRGHKSVRELRCFSDGYGGVTSGFFDDLELLVREGSSPTDGNVYITLNPAQDDLLARCCNRMKRVRSGDTTSDQYIARREWLLVDCDPARASGISATDGEKQLALERTRQVYRFLKGLGWPPMVVADSGNGMYLLVPVDLPNDDAATKLVKRVLVAISDLFSDDLVSIDLSVSNAARLIRLVGTVNRKGDSTPDRPHRVSKLVDVPEQIEVVTREQLEALAGPEPEPAPKSHQTPHNGREFDLEELLGRLEVKSHGEYSNGNGAAYRWRLDVCPFCQERDGSAVVLQFGDGRLGYRCHHNRCQGRGWADLREHLEPGYRDRREQYESSRNGKARGMPDLRPAEYRDDPAPDPTPSAGDFWQEWLDSLHDTDRLVAYDIVDGDNQLNRFKVRPAGLTVLGGLQGLGKTVLANQVTVNILLLYPELRALVANVEMSPGDLLDRQLARFAHVNSSLIQRRAYIGHIREEILGAAERLAELRDRLIFMAPPFTTEHLLAEAKRVKADIVVCDYLQRFSSGDAADQRMRVSDTMSDLRRLAMSGPAVIALSAMSREGHFRDSSEIEFGADFTYQLTKVERDGDCRLVCNCLKNRFGPLEHIELDFNGAYQEMLAPDEFVPHPEFAAYAGDFPE